jgi:hypothetical protein
MRRECVFNLTLLLFFAGALGNGAAGRGVIRVDRCFVSWGGFCPIETILGIFFVVAVFLGASLPFRWLGNYFIKSGLAQDDENQVKRGAFFVRNSVRFGYALIAGIGLVCIKLLT